MKRAIASLAALVLLFALALPALAAAPAAGQCPGYNDPANTKVDTDNDDLVLAAGLTICIHAGGENTGTIVTDGTTTLGEYIEASGIVNVGGQVPGVSNYVIYGVPSSTPTPTPTPTPVPPTPTPTPTPPTGTPTPTPPVGTLFTVPSFSIVCGGSITVANFASANVDDVLITPGNVVIDQDGTYELAPGSYTAVGRVGGVVVTAPVTFSIAVCPSTGPTPTPQVITPPPGGGGGGGTGPTAPPTDVEGVSSGSSTPMLPLLLILGAIGAGAVLLTPKRR